MCSSDLGEEGRQGREAGQGKLPTAVMTLQVFLPDSRLTAGVGRGRAGLPPRPPRCFRGKEMVCDPGTPRWKGAAQALALSQEALTAAPLP